ncbi:sigma factor-like helix-turn-helix DNA-binding protein [Alteromonas sp. 14N.309.X.WAT.G.H12]|uniref:sigma factor-like helix-turn-helix DNA-binding protein n=1 Tax=Alteromonas sp. 14N.309.X.WAT.G.H12 TaxID=3120824 RepID=UPI002FD17612
MRIELNESRIVAALAKLIGELESQYHFNYSNLKSLWEIIETLDSDSFCQLHKNVYFADFLREIKLLDNSVQLQSNTLETEQRDVLSSNLETPSESSSLYEDFDQSNTDIKTEEDKLAKKVEEKKINEDFDVPNLSTPLDEVNLPAKYLKLIKRLRNVGFNNSSFNLGDTFGDLIDLSVSEIASLNGVGASYVDTFKMLKSRVLSKANFPINQTSNTKNEFDISKIDTSNFLVCLAGVEFRFIKPLEKYARYMDMELSKLMSNFDLILALDASKLIKLRGFGQGVVDALVDFKKIVLKEIQKISMGTKNYLSFESDIIVPRLANEISLGEIEKLLLDDIDKYLDKLAEGDAEIAQLRWGFVEEKATFEEVGEMFDVTRQRMQQKEKKINDQLLLNLRLKPETLWKFLQPQMQPFLKDKVKNLYECFSSEKAFYEFLDIVCEKDNLYEYVYPEFDKNILNSYFAENGAPVHLDDAITVLEDLDLEGIQNLHNIILSLKNQGVILIDDDQLSPRLLGKSEAVACVLFDHQKGLPWQDIAKLVNFNGYSRSEIYEDRLDSEAFKHKDYIYLAGKGLYKHTRFINAELIHLDNVFAELDKYFDATSRDVVHLNQCYHSSDYLKQFDYYEIRHFVKHFGEDFGYFFVGRSQSDSVGKEKGFKNITQREVILEAMQNAGKPITKPEIATLLKSKSLAHAAFYLDKMVEEGRVAQVERQLYSTPQLAYRDINVPAYLDLMQEILMKYGLPLDTSIFQKEINNKLSVSYSKYFYLGIARCYASQRGWHRAHGLFSLMPIKFKNIRDALSTFCSRDMPRDEAVSLLRKHIAITKENANKIVQSWKHDPSNCK